MATLIDEIYLILAGYPPALLGLKVKAIAWLSHLIERLKYAKSLSVIVDQSHGPRRVFSIALEDFWVNRLSVASVLFFD